MKYNLKLKKTVSGPRPSFSVRIDNLCWSNGLRGNCQKFVWGVTFRVYGFRRIEVDIGYRTFSSWVTNLKPSHLHTTYRRREFVEWRGADRAPHTPIPNTHNDRGGRGGKLCVWKIDCEDGGQEARFVWELILVSGRILISEVSGIWSDGSGGFFGSLAIWNPSVSAQKSVSDPRHSFEDVSRKWNDSML